MPGTPCAPPAPCPHTRGYPTHRSPQASGSSVKTLSLVDFITTNISRAGKARLARISTRPSTWGPVALTLLTPAPRVPVQGCRCHKRRKGRCAFGRSAQCRRAQCSRTTPLLLRSRLPGPLPAQQRQLQCPCSRLADDVKQKHSQNFHIKTIFGGSPSGHRKPRREQAPA